MNAVVKVLELALKVHVIFHYRHLTSLHFYEAIELLELFP